MKTSVIYNVYVLDDGDNIFDDCGEFNTIIEAREYIKYQMAEDMKLLINDKYAIYINIETFLE
jgi:hypothetical protein